jgi:uncharacterized protein involved in exopolysaccharide biosynthesis
MSRIDDALKRLTGVVASEPRTSSILERFGSEDSKGEDAKNSPGRLATFVANRSPLVESRPAAPPPPKASVEPPAPRRPDRPVVETEPVPDEEKLIDVRQILDYVGFVGRSIRRHKLRMAATFLLALALTVGVAMLMPKTYRVQVKLLAQRNAVMTALSNPGRAVPWDADAPTRAAAETVLRRDNLISLIKKTDLVREWDRTRAPVLRLTDWVKALALRHQPTPEEKLDALVATLESRMFVTAGPVGDGTVTIELYWPDGDMAYRLVEHARQAFLDARQAAETSAITESITILERYSASLHEDVNRTLTELQRTQANQRGASGLPRATRFVARRPPAAAAGPERAGGGIDTSAADPSLVVDSELIRLKNEVSAKRSELGRLEEERQRQLTELQTKLAALQTVYTATHPSVQTVQQNIAAFQHESPQIVALKSAMEELEAKYDERSAANAERFISYETSRRRTAGPAPVQPAAPREEPAFVTEQPAGDAPKNEVAQFASLRLRTELNQLQSILERTDGARIELAVSEAAFKYRYTVIKPAQVPREPNSPNMRLVLLAGFLASLLLSVVVVVGGDLMSNRILEAWQVERQLGLPILGNVRIA